MSCAGGMSRDGDMGTEGVLTIPLLAVMFWPQGLAVSGWILSQGGRWLGWGFSLGSSCSPVPLGTDPAPGEGPESWLGDRWGGQDRATSDIHRHCSGSYLSPPLPPQFWRHPPPVTHCPIPMLPVCSLEGKLGQRRQKKNCPG